MQDFFDPVKKKEKENRILQGGIISDSMKTCHSFSLHLREVACLEASDSMKRPSDRVFCQ